MSTFNPHRVEISIDRDGDIDATFCCDAAVGAPCRLWCDEGCESAGADHGTYHELSDQGMCGQTEGWFDDAPFESYSGEQAPLRSGRVLLHWEGDYYTWSYDPTPRIGDTVQIGDKTGTITGFLPTRTADGIYVDVLIPHDEKPAPSLTPTLVDLPR